MICIDGSVDMTLVDHVVENLTEMKNNILLDNRLNYSQYSKVMMEDLEGMLHHFCVIV